MPRGERPPAKTCPTGCGNLLLCASCALCGYYHRHSHPITGETLSEDILGQIKFLGFL
jgi:hypothetical protein